MITPSDKKLYRDAIHAIETMDENDPLRKTLIWWCNTHQDVRMGLFEEKNIYEVKYAFKGKCIGRKEYQCEIFCKENSNDPKGDTIRRYNILNPIAETCEWKKI